MCGIAGYVGAGEREDLERMHAAIAHRGPDDSGTYVGEGVGLTHARLAIIDVSHGGHQPMWNTNKTVVIVYNGELYNFKELRAELEVKGVTFTTESDTEVILALYGAYGEDCFEKMRGMFAIALYDTKTKTLLLARDAMGEKPLYVGTYGDTLVFGSELTAVLAHPAAMRTVDTEALSAYLVYNAVPSPLAMASDVHMVLPGQVERYQGETVTSSFFYTPRTAHYTGTFTEALEELDIRLASSVAHQLVSDVPLGILLSGGLDSSTIAYYAAQVSATKVQTFSIGFDDASYDESKYAREVAEHLGTEHHTLMLTGADIVAHVPAIVDSLNEPLADSSYLATYMLAKLVRQHVTVALGGDGADELFAGYSTFTADKALPLYQSIPEVLTRGIGGSLVAALPASHSYMSVRMQVERFLRAGQGSSAARAHQEWMEGFSRTEQEALFTPETLAVIGTADPYVFAEQSFAEFPGDRQTQLLWTYARRYLGDQVLAKTDRASMAHALEIRAPFLDKDLVSFAFSLPYEFKQRGTTGKYILRELMKDKIPASSALRKKHGFAVPLSAWLRKELSGYMHETLSGESLLRAGFFESAYVERLMAEHEAGRRDHARKLWPLIVFMAWYNRVITV